MATFQRSDSIGDSANRQDLYDLINTAEVKNLTAADVIGLGSVAITATSSYPGTPTVAVWWWDMHDQLLKMPVNVVGSDSAEFYASVGPDCWDFPGYNICSYTIEKGTLVRWDTSVGANPYGCTPMEPMVTFMTSGRDLRAHDQMRSVYGFASAHIPPTSYGPIATEGYSRVKVDWPTYDALYLDTGNHQFWPLIPSTQYTGYVQTTYRTAGLPTYITQVATGVARPTTTGMSVLAPALIHLPAGRVGQLQ
jgi:hypothetical protein